MKYSYPKSEIDALKSQVNIVEVIGRNVELKRAGSGYKACCPFHREKTPSFSVSETHQYFHCFGCGEKGDVITFVMKYFNLDFTEAVEKLATEYGIQLHKQGYRDDGSDRIYEINRMAAEWFYRRFTSGKNPGLTYMIGRGIEPRTLKRFGIGYADGEWSSLKDALNRENVKDQELLDAGLVSESRGRIFDKFRDRVMFPIINTSGKVIGFGGRALRSDERAKYLNSPETKVFQKKNNLYALNSARTAAGREGFIILVEGYMDAISLYQSGIENVAASLGTALTDNQARLLRRYTKRVVLSYDADQAGRNAALRGIEVLRDQGIDVRVLHVTDGKDPDEFVKKNGKDAFLRLVDGAMPYADYRLDSAKRGVDTTTRDGRIRYLKAAANILRALDPVEQEEYADQVAADMNISPAVLMREIEAGNRRGDPRERAARTRARSGPGPEGRSDPGTEREKRRETLPSVDRTLVKLFLTVPAYLEKIAASEELLESDFAKELLAKAKTSASEGRAPDTAALLDTLPDEERAEVRDILENVIITPEQAQDVFEDCQELRKIQRLKAEEEDLITSLSMAGDVAPEQDIRRMTEDLKNVQSEIRRLNQKQRRSGS